MRPIKVYKKGRTVRASSLNNPIILYLKLISHNRIEFLGLVDHALHLRHGGDAVAEIFHVVDLDKFCMQIGGNTMSQLIDGVNTGGLEQFGELACYAFDAEQVGMVRPLKNKFDCDTAFPSKSLAAFGSSRTLKQLFGSYDARLFKLPGTLITDTFDLVNFVSHNIQI